MEAPRVFRPQVGPFQVSNLNKVYGIDPEDDIFVARELSREGVVVVVRPDQYVANVLPLSATDELMEFFRPILTQ